MFDSLYFPSDRYDANEAVLFVAKRQQEAQNIRSRDIHDLACHPGVWDNGGLSLHWHHRGYLCTLGKHRQFRSDADDAVLHAFRWIHSAAVADDFLLCSHRLYATHQGNNHRDYPVTWYIPGILSSSWKLYTANEVAYTKTTFRIYCYSYYELYKSS